MVRYHLAVEDEGSEQLMVAATPFVGTAFAVGEQVKVSWDAGDLWPIAH
jgi:hypothetical protein